MLITDTRSTPPNLDTGLISSTLILTELILFPGASIAVSLFLRESALARATGVTAVPEPGTTAFVLIGVVALAGLRRARRRRR